MNYLLGCFCTDSGVWGRAPSRRRRARWFLNSKVHSNYFKLPKIYKLRTQPLVSCVVVIVILTLGVPPAAPSTLKLLQINKIYVFN